MNAYKSKVTISNNRKLEIQLPSDMPEGEADIIILSENRSEKDVSHTDSSITLTRLDQWINSIPPVPHIPISSIDRDDIYK